jgi:hypothetical protein
VLEVADIIRRHGAAVRAHLGTRLLPSQARALRDLVACRTAACGGQLTQCTACGGEVYRYHSCLMESKRFWGARPSSRVQTPDVQRIPETTHSP